MYWIGWSDVGAKSPEDHEVHIVASDEDLADVTELVIERLYDDWYDEGLDEDE